MCTTAVLNRYECRYYGGRRRGRICALLIVRVAVKAAKAVIGTDCPSCTTFYFILLFSLMANGLACPTHESIRPGTISTASHLFAAQSTPCPQVRLSCIHTTIHMYAICICTSHGRSTAQLPVRTPFFLIILSPSPYLCMYMRIACNRGTDPSPHKNCWEITVLPLRCRCYPWRIQLCSLRTLT